MSVLYSVRLIAAVLSITAAALLWLFTGDIPVFVIAVGLAVWFQLYLSGQKIELHSDKIIKRSGRLFRRRTVLFINNISWLHTVSFCDSLPALMKITYPGSNVHLIGFTGRQLAAVERAVLHTSK